MTEIGKLIFYGKNLNACHAEHESKVNELSKSLDKTNFVPKRRRLMEPSQFFGVYSTQQEALDVANQRSSSSLHTFVFQDKQGYRKFVVAHPEVYWEMDECKSPELRCSYEVIADGAPCHLYFDLEYPKDLNPAKNGSKITKTLIDIICAYFSEHWGLPCKRCDVLSLDSTTEHKFSRHLIFRVKNMMFKNNKHVGRFVKKICADIKHNSIVNYKQPSAGDILGQFLKEDIEDLFVETDKGRKLFIDEGVYTKNRHFRIYKSTKWGKNSHLRVSDDSEFISNSEYRNKDLGIFLESLISYMPSTKNLILLEYQDNGTADAIKYTKDCLSQRTCSTVREKESPYPSIDKFILDIVYPGKIRDIKYTSQDTLSYGIADNRYCENIGRQHKSNGIYWVVDLRKKIAFQKCFDNDCRGFKSTPKKLPDEISFQLDEENDLLLASVPEPQVSPQCKSDIISALEDDSLDAELTKIETNQIIN